MLSKFLYLLTFLLGIVLVLFLNGNVNIGASPLPPLGKFLNPFKGVWVSDNRAEKNDLTTFAKDLSSEVRIIYDERRVPHIFANNLGDALFAQGYVEAQNRLFQMEFVARAAGGELSEVLGDRTLEYDIRQRRKGMQFAAENAVAGWEKTAEYSTIERYIAGVNAYISQLKPEDFPFEYKLFDASPRAWSDLQSALIFKYMAETLAYGHDDILNTNLSLSLGLEDFSYLFKERERIETPIIPTENPYDFVTINGLGNTPQRFYDKTIPKANILPAVKGIGSNSWAVSGDKSTTGSPIFCNDPHLTLGLPSIWLEIHIVTPEFNSYGVSVPGLPGIMIGFNENIAWGETNVGQDVLDIFAIEWVDADKMTYRLDGQERKAEIRVETIKIKGAKPYIDRIKHTYWGPVYKESVDGTQDLAMRWLCHDGNDKTEYSVFVNTMRATNYKEFLAATEPYVTPAQNFGFACVDGDIAMRVNGLFPAKSENDGRFVEYGDRTSNNWQTWIPKSQVPQIVNPTRGFVSSANQVSADSTYPYYFTGMFERHRNRIINDTLAYKATFSPADMQQLHQNSVSYKARDFIMMLREVVSPDILTSDEQEWYSALTNWDYSYRADIKEPILFSLFYKQLASHTWDEIDALRETLDVKYPEDWRLLDLILHDSDNKYFDLVNTEKKENAIDIVLLSFKAAVAEMTTLLDKSPELTWSKHRNLNIMHLTRVPALSELGVESDGCGDAINATTSSTGPSWRMVVSLEEDVKAYGIYPGGQSGNPCSKYYKNMIAPWAKGEYYPLSFIKKPEEIKTVTQTLTLNTRS